MHDGSSNIPDIDAMLDRFAQTGELDEAMRNDPRVRAAFDLQDRIDASLRRNLDPPTNEALAQRVRDAMSAESMSERSASHESGSRAVVGRIGWIRRLAVAAVLAGGVFGGWLMWQQLRPQEKSMYDAGPWQAFGDWYDEYVEEGFTPQWVCETEAIFAETFKTQLGEAVVLRDVPAETRALGLAYCHSISRETIALLVESRGQSVLLFIDRSDADDHAETWAIGENLNRFSTTVGSLVVHEVTPLSEPVMMHSLRLIEPNAPATS